MAIYQLDIKDTINRIRSVGKLIDLTEESNFAKITNALLSIERARLDTAVERTKKHLGDWAGAELDNWWGTILSLERLSGVEDVNEFIGDGSYIARIRKYMEAANSGISLDAVRKAAEAGGGVPFRIYKADNRIILVPLESISPANRAGILRAVHRIAPARAIIELAEPESYDASDVINVWSDSVYVGTDPRNLRANGPVWDSENMMIVATADKWAASPEGTLSPGTGLPNLLMSGGTWGVPNMGFGEHANLTFGTEADEIINRVKFSIGTGVWRIIIFADDTEILSEEIDGKGWFVFDKTFNFIKGSSISVRFTNTDQNVQSLYVRGAYVGARVDDANRTAWLALGGKKGRSTNDIVISDPLNIFNGGEWVCKPAPDPSMTRDFYAQVSGSPRIVSALGFKTRTPGALFKISYTTEDLKRNQDYTDLNWIELPIYYKLKNGRVDVEPFKAKHIKLTFSNLRPMLLKEFYTE